MQNKQHLAATLAGIGAIGVFIALLCTAPVTAQVQNSAAVFTADGKLKLPKGYRKWVFVGAPLTPNALNKPEANFPEYHNVYIQAQNVDAYLKTGEFPEGTVIIKELTRLVNPTFPDGSRTEPSGRGFFNGEFNGIDATVKDSKRFAKTVFAVTPGISWLKRDGRAVKTVPELDATVEVMASSPAKGAACSMPRVFKAMFVACFTVASVRASVAPGGNCTRLMR